MLIDGTKIASYLQKLLKKEVLKLKKKKRPHLIVFLAKESPEQLSFVKIKSRHAREIGAGFELINFKSTPSFQKFASLLKEKSIHQETTGTIIQQPLPQELSTDSIYNYIPDVKEIEGVKKKSPFFPPIGLAVLTMIKFIYGKGKLTPDLFVDIDRDRVFFKKLFKNKKVVLVGRGITGGKPIGKILTDVKINYISINSQTPNPESYYNGADLIITAVGKKIIEPSMLKPGVVLINVGVRKEGSRLKGDYDEAEVKNIAASYTPTPGGVGPIDVIYLYKNLIDATKLQR
ncbi:MAG: tetrahydrofolate dehydrogenase/cyclohydrolase catalytic domain-containing protein [Patescibacteria group bacterium]